MFKKALLFEHLFHFSILVIIFLYWVRVEMKNVVINMLINWRGIIMPLTFAHPAAILPFSGKKDILIFPQWF